MDLYEIDVAKKADHMMSVYSSKFKTLFGSVPVIDDHDRSALRRIAKSVSGGKEKLADIVAGMFELEDDYLRQSGFKLQFLESRVNAILSKLGAQKSKAAPGSTMISTKFACDGCGEYFDCVVPMNYNWNDRTLCKKCK